jgi:hypothetical protein
MAITTILFKRGNAPLPADALLPGEPGWRLDTGELYIGMPGGGQKKINELSASEKATIISGLADIADDLDHLEERTIPLMIRDAIAPVNSQISNNRRDIQANSIITAGKGCCTEITITDRSPYTLTSDLQSYNMSCTVLSISAPRQALLPGMAVLFMDDYLDYFGTPSRGIKMGIISSYTEATSALTCRMVTRWEAVEIGNIIMSKETATTSANNARHPELVVFTPQILPFIKDGIFVKTPDSAIFVKQTYTPKTITGGNIYIQNTEPSNPQNNDVWFDTRQIGD